MKLLFIGSRLFDDVSWYTKNEDITTIVTESNKNAINLDLADKKYIVSRGMDEPANIAIKEDVDAVIPLIGIDLPLIEVGKLKDKLESENNIPVVASGYGCASLAADKYNTKKFLQEVSIKTPSYDKVIKFDDDLLEKLPFVLKTPEGQGGSGVKIALNKEDVEEFINSKDNIFIEEYVEGFEASIEVLRWNNETIALTPIYKGNTTLEGKHPLAKIKKGPLSIEGIDNKQHNESIRQLAENVANLVGMEGTMDIDILHDNKSKDDYIIELNTRPSGTRYMTAASSNIYPLCQLVDMAKGNWSRKSVLNDFSSYYSTELPIGDFPKDQMIPKIKRFDSNESYIVHGPQHYQRVTIRSESKSGLTKLAHNIVSDYAKNNNLSFE